MTNAEKRDNFRKLDREIRRCQNWADYSETNRKLNITDNNGGLFKKDLEILVKHLGWMRKTLEYQSSKQR